MFSAALIITTFLIGSFTSSGCGRDPWEGLQDIMHIRDQWSVRMGGRCEQEKEKHKRLTLVANVQLKILIFRDKIVLNLCLFFLIERENVAVHS